MRAVTNVDIDRFMGDWYVIANIPTFVERNAINPIENYQRDEDGNIATTFTFEKDGRQKTMTMTAFVHEAPDNGIWDMQLVWPFRADYRIIYLDAGYQTTIIGRNKRDYLWIMSREPRLEAAKLYQLLDLAVELGYEREKIQLTSWQQSPTSVPATTEGRASNAL